MPSYTSVSSSYSSLYSVCETYAELASDFDTHYSTSDVNFFSQSLNQSTNASFDSSLLPPGVRFAVPGFIVFEQPPTRKIVSYIPESLSSMQEMSSDDPENFYIDDLVQTYEIPIPWQLYFITYSLSPHSLYQVTSVRMYFMNTPLSTPDVTLYAPYIPNFYLSGDLCPPKFADYDEISKYPSNVAGAIAAAYDWVWNTGFNNDLTEPLEKTFTTKNLNSIVNKYLTENFNYDIPTFYQFLSKYTSEQVTQEPWLNFSYSQYWANDIYLLFNIPYYRDKFSSEHSCDSSSYYDEENDEYYEEEHDPMQCFANWFGNTQKISKTFKDLMTLLFNLKEDNSNSLRYFEYFNYISNNLNKKIDINYFLNHMIKSFQ